MLHVRRDAQQGHAKAYLRTVDSDIVVLAMNIPPRAPFDHTWAMVWSGARGNITITAL